MLRINTLSEYDIISNRGACVCMSPFCVLRTMRECKKRQIHRSWNAYASIAQSAERPRNAWKAAGSIPASGQLNEDC